MVRRLDRRGAFIALGFGSALAFTITRSLTDPGPENYLQLLQGSSAHALTTSFRASARADNATPTRCVNPARTTGHVTSIHHDYWYHSALRIGMLPGIASISMRV